MASLSTIMFSLSFPHLSRSLDISPDCWGIKNQLDVTCCLYFTYICSTCFEH